MFAHITLGSNNLPRAIQFYDALLSVLNISRRPSPEDNVLVCYEGEDATLPKFFICTPFNDNAASAGNGTMVAFQARSQQTVDESYQAGLKNGGTDEGPPGERPNYANGYYGAYLRDPDGNKVHIVFRGDLSV